LDIESCGRRNFAVALEEDCFFIFLSPAVLNIPDTKNDKSVANQATPNVTKNNSPIIHEDRADIDCMPVVLVNNEDRWTVFVVAVVKQEFYII